MNIKNWAEKRLARIDVDVTLEWLIDLKKKILTDAISSEDEKMFLKHIVHYKKVDFNFKNLYELAKEYKPYLLVRMRYRDHKTLANFIEQYKNHYKKAKEIEDKLSVLSAEILNAAPEGQREIKRLSRELQQYPSEKVIRRTIELLSTLKRSENGQEGLNAFIEKRVPEWK